MPRNGLKKNKRMAIEQNDERGVVTPIKDGYLVSSPDGIDSEFVSKSAVDAIAADLQQQCNDNATRLQRDCNDNATVQQRFVPTPDNGKPLEEDEIFKAVENFLDNPEWISKNSKYKNIDEVLKNQNSMPKSLIKALKSKGIFVKAEVFERRILPLYRLKQKDKAINNLKKINMILAIAFISSLTAYFFKNPKNTETLSYSKNEVTEFVSTDSVCTYSELHELVKAYSEVSNIKIYPYSEQVILERINAKKITSVEGIKKEIEFRIKEIKQ